MMIKAGPSSTCAKPQARRSAVCCRALASAPAAAPCPGLVQKAQLCSQVATIWRNSAEAKQQDVQYLKQQLSQVNWMGALVLPFAAATTAAGGMGGQGELYAAVAKAFDIYLVVLTVRVLASWFKPNWASEPWNTLRQFTDPYLNLFRGVIPTLGGMDLSPMLGFFLLQFVRNQVYRMSLYASL